jgi:hypothetical protein
MRALILASAVSLASAASAQASPVWRNTAGIGLGAAPHIELVRDGCGRGWHRDRWRDQSGDWHWGHCIPNGGPRDAWTAGWSHPYPNWRAEPPRWGWGYQ